MKNKLFQKKQENLFYEISATDHECIDYLFKDIFYVLI